MDIHGVFDNLIKGAAPTMLNTLLPPLPKTVAENKVVQSISPTPISKGPPLPSGLNISWPAFFMRSGERLATEGLKGPYKTIKEKGLMAEIKREIGVITGAQL